MSEKEELEKVIRENRRIVNEGIALHSAQDIQFAKDKITTAYDRLKKIDYEERKPFIKIATVTNQVTGNSSIKERRGKKFKTNENGVSTLF